jgi:hypothetical protein
MITRSRCSVPSKRQVPCGNPVNTTYLNPHARQCNSADTRIISVHREEIIAQRRLHVIEEVHVTLRGREERRRAHATNKVVVERDGTVSGE